MQSNQRINKIFVNSTQKLVNFTFILIKFMLLNKHQLKII